ncbi:MAG: phosphoglycerate kinase [Patescibacteria group bacterium]|nr:phosphoglycerate kinase [Patescibacteria group bacterium]
MNIRKLHDLDVSKKKVIVRMDLDVDNDFSRIELSKDTLDYLLNSNSKVIIIGHKGRPEGRINEELSLQRLVFVLEKLLGRSVFFIRDIFGAGQEKLETMQDGDVVLLENIRFDRREEENDLEFARHLASLAQCYVNEAFAVSHRAHASIIGIPNFLPSAAGFRFEKEVEMLLRVLENPNRPIVAVISGVKRDKMDYISHLVNHVDRILAGGLLPKYYGDENPYPDKLIIGSLTLDNEDINSDTIEIFKAEIAKAGTIVLAGVPGKYEDEDHRQGTKEVFTAIANSHAYKVAGGGDAEAAITLLNLNDKFDWISVGGGAMLEYLSLKTLPGIEALVQK